MNKIAIIGSGPSGCFLAEILAMKLDAVKIDLYERLPHPFGLAVSGVAPDHLNTRKVIEQFQRTLDRPEVTLICNTQIGQDLSYAQLKASYDQVIFAVGAEQDRRLNIPGEQLTGVYGSGEITRWYNNHPDLVTLKPEFGKKVGIIGHGNVALDIARMLAKTAAEHQPSDLSAAVRAQLADHAIEEIHLLGRRRPAEVSFTLAELAELGSLSQAQVMIQSTDLHHLEVHHLPMSQQKVLQQLKQFAEQPEDPTKKIRIQLHFHATPVAIEGEQQLEKLQLKQTLSGAPSALPLDSVITAIGYQTPRIDGVPYDEDNQRLAHQGGVIEPGVYCLGWCQRGPQGVIPTNRSEAMGLAKRIMKELGA